MGMEGRQGARETLQQFDGVQMALRPQQWTLVVMLWNFVFKEWS
jgi:hypothetical protein